MSSISRSRSQSVEDGQSQSLPNINPPSQRERSSSRERSSLPMVKAPSPLPGSPMGTPSPDSESRTPPSPFSPENKQKQRRSSRSSLPMVRGHSPTGPFPKRGTPSPTGGKDRRASDKGVKIAGIRTSMSNLLVSPRGGSFSGPSQSPRGSLSTMCSVSKMSKEVGGGEVDVEKELLNLLKNMDTSGDEKVPTEELRQGLELTGLHPLLLDLAVSIIDEDGDGEITFEEILNLRTPENQWIVRALVNDLSIRDMHSFSSVLNQCFTESNVEPEDGDACLDVCNANLSKEKAASQFGAAFCSVDGQFWEKGTTHDKFTLQAASFPIMYCKSIEAAGTERVHTIVGREPRGQGTSEYQMDRFGKPHNPMISLGAIATASLVHPEMDLADRFKVMTSVMNSLTANCDGSVTFDNYNYLKESQSAVKEYSLAYGAKEKEAFPGVESHDDLTRLLQFHFMCEAIEINCRQLSIVAATLARGGINPISRERVFDSETAQHCLSVLFTCGLKELTGAFAFEIGLPAKCGASGALMVVIPGVGGLALHSPLVTKDDKISLKGVTFCHTLLHHFPFHIFDSEATKLDQVASEYGVADVYQLIYSAANGDLTTVRKLILLRGLDPNSADYDNRTALHLAVAERRRIVIDFLLKNGAFVRCADRWGKTPLDEAKGDEELEKLLQSFDIQIPRP